MRPARTAPFIAPLVLLVSPLTTGAQVGASSTAPPHATAERARAALEPLAALVGQWEGDAEMVRGPGAATRVRQYEDVVFGAGRTVLMIRGTGKSTERSTAGAIVFEAAATIWFDADANRLRMRAHRAEGVAVDAEVELKPDTLVWGFAVPGGRVQYTVAYDATQWHEVGQYMRDGAGPVQFIEMRLKKLP